MGRVNAVVMPVFATVICIVLVAYHLKDPTQDGQVCVAVFVLIVIHGPAYSGCMMCRIVCLCISMSLSVGVCGCGCRVLCFFIFIPVYSQLLDGMEMAAEKMEHTQKLRVLEGSGVLQEVPTQRAAVTLLHGRAVAAILGPRSSDGETGVEKHLTRVRRVLERLRSGASSARIRTQGHPGAQHAVVQKVQGLLELQQLSLSDEIDIKVPSSGKHRTVQHVWTDEGWVEKRVADTWVAPTMHDTGNVGHHSSAHQKAQKFTLSSAQQAWDNWVNTALLGQKLVTTVTSTSKNTERGGDKTTGVRTGNKASGANNRPGSSASASRSATYEAVTSAKSTSGGKMGRVVALATMARTGMGSSSSSTRNSSSKKGRTAKLALDSSSEGVGEGGSVGQSMFAPMSVRSFAGRYGDDVPGGASGGESGPFRDNPEGQPGGWYHYVDDEGNDKFYSEHTVGMRKGPYSVLGPRTPLLDQGSHEDGDLTGGTAEEADRGLLSDERDHKVRYKGEDGQIHYYRPYGVVTSVHKGKRLLCLKNCDTKAGERNTPVGVSYTPGPDVWPNLALPLKQQKEEDQVEAQEGDEDEVEEPNSAVEKETQNIHRALSELRQRTREQADVGGEDSLEALDKRHDQLQASLELAKKVTKDAEYQAYLEYSIHDLARQLNASEIALDYAQKDDFSYIGKLVPGQQEGELGYMFQELDPLLLNSIRRGDFVKGSSNDTVPYEDSAGNPINDDEMQKLTDQSGKVCAMYAIPEISGGCIAVHAMYPCMLCLS